MTCLYLKCYILLLLWQCVSTEMTCTQQQLGFPVLLHCPPGPELMLGYCCNYNGKISCCSYEDFSQMHGHDTAAVICLIVTGSLTVVILGVLLYMRCRNKDAILDSTEAGWQAEKVEECNKAPVMNLIPTILISPAESVQNTVHSRPSLMQNTIQSTQSWSSSRYGEVLQNIFKEDEETKRKSSAIKKVSFAGIDM